MILYAAKSPRPELKGVIRDIRVNWMLEELGVPYERKVLDPSKGENLSAEYTKIHPFGKVPALVDGGHAIFESGAICLYLAEKYNRFIPPHGTLERADFYQWTCFAITSLETAGLMHMRGQVFEKDPVKKTVWLDSSEAQMKRFAAPLNKRLSENPYILGKDFSVADILMATSFRFLLGGEPHYSLKESGIAAYLERCFSRPGFQHALGLNGEA